MSGYELSIALKVKKERKCKFCRANGVHLFVNHISSSTTKRKGRWGRLDKVFCQCSKCGHESEHRFWTPILHEDMFGGLDLS